MRTTISEAELQAITERIVDTVQPEKIILFGSYADGTATPDSDVDLLVVQDTTASHIQRYRIIRRALRDFNVGFDILVYTPQEIEKRKAQQFAFVNIIQRNGKVVYEA